MARACDARYGWAVGRIDKMLPTPPNAILVDCDLPEGHDGPHSGPDYMGQRNEWQGMVPRVSWTDADQRSFRGEWQPCPCSPQCHLPALHHGRHSDKEEEIPRQLRFETVREGQASGGGHRVQVRRMNLTPERSRPVYGWYWALVGSDGRTVARGEVEATEEAARLGAEAAAAAFIGAVLRLGDRPFDDLIDVDQAEWFRGVLDGMLVAGEEA